MTVPALRRSIFRGFGPFFERIILPTVAWVTWGLWGHFMDAYRTGERSGSGGFNPIVWPFKFILLVGFAIFTLQILAEIIKRAEPTGNAKYVDMMVRLAMECANGSHSR